MDKSRIIHGIQNYASSDSSFVDSDESDDRITEKRAKNLLEQIDKIKKKKNIFTDNNVDHPKLRRSIVARAVRNLASSTPLLTTTNSLHFINEHSLNISPINVLSDIEMGCENAYFPNTVGQKNETQFVPITSPKYKEPASKIQNSMCLKKRKERRASFIEDKNIEDYEKSDHSNRRGNNNSEIQKGCKKKNTAVNHTSGRKNKQKKTKKRSSNFQIDKVTVSNKSAVNSTSDKENPRVNIISNEIVCTKNIDLVDDASIGNNIKTSSVIHKENLERRLSNIEKHGTSLKSGNTNVTKNISNTHRDHLEEKNSDSDCQYGILNTSIKKYNSNLHMKQSQNGIVNIKQNKVFIPDETISTSVLQNNIQYNKRDISAKTVNSKDLYILNTSRHDRPFRSSFQNNQNDSEHDIKNKIQRRSLLDELIKNVSPKNSKKLSISDVIPQLSTNMKKNGINFCRSLRYSQPRYEDSDSSEEMLQSDKIVQTSQNKIPETSRHENPEPVDEGLQSDKELQTIRNNIHENSRYEDVGETFLHGLDGQLYKSLDNVEDITTNFSTSNTFLNGILEKSAKKLPWRVSSEARRSSVTLNFLKSAQPSKEEMQRQRLSQKDIDFTYSDNDTSVFIYPRSVREKYGLCEKISSTNVSQDDDHSSAFARFSRDSLQQNNVLEREGLEQQEPNDANHIAFQCRDINEGLDTSHRYATNKDSGRSQKIQSSTSHQHLSIRVKPRCSLTRQPEESNRSGSKRKTYTPVSKTGKNKDQENFMVHKSSRGSFSREEVYNPDITPTQNNMPRVILSEQPTDMQHNITTEHNQNPRLSSQNQKQVTELITNNQNTDDCELNMSIQLRKLKKSIDRSKIDEMSNVSPKIVDEVKVDGGPAGTDCSGSKIRKKNEDSRKTKATPLIISNPPIARPSNADVPETISTGIDDSVSKIKKNDAKDRKTRAPPLMITPSNSLIATSSNADISETISTGIDDSVSKIKKNNAKGRKTKATPLMITPSNALIATSSNADISETISTENSTNNNLFKKPCGRPKRSLKRLTRLSNSSTYSETSSSTTDLRRSSRQRRPPSRIQFGVLEVNSIKEYNLFKKDAVMNKSLIDETKLYKSFKQYFISSQRNSYSSRLSPVQEIQDQDSINAPPRKELIEGVNIKIKELKVNLCQIQFSSKPEKDIVLQNQPVTRSLEKELQSLSTSQINFSLNSMDNINNTDYNHQENDTANSRNLMFKDSDAGSSKRKIRKRSNANEKNQFAKKSNSYKNQDKHSQSEELTTHGDNRQNKHFTLEIPQECDTATMLGTEELLTMKFVEHNTTFRPVDNVFMTDFTACADGRQMGLVKIPPGWRKPFRVSEKTLIYCVVAGRGRLQLRASIQQITTMSRFIIPLGMEYSIINENDQDDMILFCITNCTQ